MELGKKIASLRKRNQITQAQLAEYLAVQPQTISRWEADGGTPDVMLLPKIATFFGVSLDELFGMGDMEQIENLVYKYSVLRDEKSFEEVMRRIDDAIENIDEQASEQKCEQLLAWKVHVFIQQSRKATEEAEKHLDELIEKVKEQDNPLYMPLRLQKQQLRIQRGEVKQALQEAKENWEQERNLNSLYFYMMSLLEVRDGAEILALWEQDEVQTLVGVITEKTEPLWLAMFAGARIEQKVEFLKNYLSRFEKDAAEQAVFDAEWELFLMYHELDMQVEKQLCKQKLLEKMERLNFNEYIKSVYLKKIEEL